MSILDVLGELDDSGTALTATRQSTDIIDVVTADLNLGTLPIWLNIQVGSTDMDSNTDTSTLVVSLVTDSDTTITNGTTIYSTPAIAEATLVAGYKILRMPLPLNVDLERYIGIVYTVANENFTTGGIDAWLDDGSATDHGTQVTASNLS